MRQLVAVCAVALAIAAVPADAAVYTLSPEGREPQAAVDASGTAHVVWEVERQTPQPDELVYCRIPRGATACADQRTFTPPGAESGGERVVFSTTGQVVLVSWRICCFETGLDTRVYTLTSDDDGTTFSEPKAVGDFHWGATERFDAAFGPGDFSISMAAGGSGGKSAFLYQQFPLNEFTETQAELADFPKAYHASIAFENPTRPMVAYSDLNSMFVRRWSGEGNRHDPATWESELALGKGAETHLAYGPRGVYLFYSDRETFPQYHVRRFDEVPDYDGTGFGKPLPVSNTSMTGTAFGDFIQDPGETLHAVWREPGLHHRTWRKGNEDWDRTERLASDAEADSLFNLQVAAAPDAGGVVVGDANGKGPIRFAPFKAGGSSGATGACPTSVTLGKAVVRALTGCFAKKGGARVASGPVKVNGMDVKPATSGSPKAAAAFTVTVDPKQRTLATNQSADVFVGEVVLDKAKLHWRFPKGDGKIVRLGGSDTTLFPDVGKYGKYLLSFPIDGDAEVSVKGEGVEIPISFGLGPLLSFVTADGTVKTNANGPVHKGLRLEAGLAPIGPLHVANIGVNYIDDPDIFEGFARFRLPPLYKGTLDPVGFGFREGQLEHAEFTATLPAPIPLWPPFLSLQSIGMAYEKKPDSRIFKGGLSLVFTKEIAGMPIVRVNALPPANGFTAEFPASGPATFDARGTVELLSLDLASGFVNFRTDGVLKFGGGLTMKRGIFSATFSIPEDEPGLIDLVNGEFSVTVDVTGCIDPPGTLFDACAEGSGTISTKGVALCATVAGDDYGIRFTWGGEVSSGCGFSSFKPPGLRKAQDGTAFALPSGLAKAGVLVEGDGGPPGFTLTAPNGEAVDSDGPLKQGRFVTYAVPEQSATMVHVKDPPTGEYRLTPKSGPPAVVRVRVAEGLPPATVKAKVGGKGHRRVLSYSVKRRPGQHVTFVERSADAFGRIGTAKSARGEIAFTPASGRAGRREIVAIVDNGGVPAETIAVTSYRAQAPVRLRAPRVRVRRQGARLVASWGRVSGAREYRVTARLPRDGRRLFFATAKTSLSIKGIEGEDSGLITVTAIGADARPGRPGKSALRSRRARPGRAR